MFSIEKINKWKLLFHLLFFLSTIFLLIRPIQILGIDSFGFFLLSCHAVTIFPPLIPTLFFSHLPCNELVYNLFAILFFYIFIVVLSKLIGLFYEKEKLWKVMCLMWLVPSITNWFYQFEDASMGLILITLFWYFYFKAKINKDNNLRYYPLLLIPVGYLFWHWALIPLIALSFENLIAIGITLIVSSYLGFNTVFGAVLPLFDSHNQLLAENQPGLAVFGFFMILIGMFNFRKEFRRIASIITFLGLFAAKFMYLALPFLMIGAYDFFSRFEIRWKNFPWINYSLFKKTLIICIFFIAVPYQLFSTIYNFVPTVDDFVILGESINYSKDTNLQLLPEWSLGYWLMYLGTKTDNYGGWSPTNGDFNHSIAVTVSRKLDCGLIKENKNLMRIKIYYCP